MAKGAKTGGRQAGTPNKATAAVKEAAALHGPKAVLVLAGIMNDAEAPPAARVAAANAILDRWAGKPAQAVTGPDGGPIATKVIHEEAHGSDGA